MYALISVSDKTGIVQLAKQLISCGIQLISTGGTARLLNENNITVKEVAELTGFPEMLDGRVKTLHPRIHAGLLARRDSPEHMAALSEHHIQKIDIVVVNLYPFEKTVANIDCTIDDAIENIDIGGPSMVRSAAKNWRDVTILTDVNQYESVFDELKNEGKISQATRFSLAKTAFNRIAQYDAAISNYLSSVISKDETGNDIAPIGCDTPKRMEYGEQNTTCYVKVQDLRYGENAHQSAALYRDLYPSPGSLVTAKQVQGKELSYNNLADADAAWACVKSFQIRIDGPACVIVKHANPCGAALGSDASDAYQRAYETDATSAFGGVIAFNCMIDLACAHLLSRQFIEVLIAPSFHRDVLDLFKSKTNVRLLQIDLPPGGNESWLQGHNAIDVKRIGSGLLLQTSDFYELTASDMKVVTKKQPTKEQLIDLFFAWKIVRYVKSNAIVFCKGGRTYGLGAGQMSRLDSARIASIKAGYAGLDLHGSVVASDAFFPFRDGLDVVVDAGATCVIHPGGSMRDEEVIAAANERGIAMVFTGIRHFRH
jgi:phosphoribosylaminoimidazolecarboxamide formyltransferase / IMP cyclohydrolase